MTPCFLDNRYTKIYFSIVDKAAHLGRKKTGQVYFEEHHILPLAMGGSDAPDNLVMLTAREHFVCHLLLTKMTVGQHQIRMRHAFSFMVLSKSNTHQRMPSSRMYETARIFAKQKRDSAWAHNISAALKGRPQKPEAVQRMAASLKGRSLSEEHKRKIGQNNARHNAKYFTAITPSGEQLVIYNLRKFCNENHLDHQNAWLNLSRSKPIAKGRMRGWKFNRC